MPLMLLALLAVAFVVLLPFIGIGALLKPQDKSSRDRSAKSVEPLACGCIVLLVLAIAATLYFAQSHQ